MAFDSTWIKHVTSRDALGRLEPAKAVCKSRVLHLFKPARPISATNGASTAEDTGKTTRSTMSSALPPIPDSPPAQPANSDVPAAPNPSSANPAYGPRPPAGEFALPIPEQIRALLQSRLAVTLADGRVLRGTLTSVDSTSVLMTNVEELREVASANVRKYWPWSKDGINAGYDEDGGAGAGAGASAGGVGREAAGRGSGAGRAAGQGGGEGEGKGEAGETGEEEREGEAEGEGRVGGGGPASRIRRRELQSILVQFAHCRRIELDAEDHAAWRRYCEVPAEMRAQVQASRLQMGQVI